MWMYVYTLVKKLLKVINFLVTDMHSSGVKWFIKHRQLVFNIIIALYIHTYILLFHYFKYSLYIFLNCRKQTWNNNFRLNELLIANSTLFIIITIMNIVF